MVFKLMLFVMRESLFETFLLSTYYMYKSGTIHSFIELMKYDFYLFAQQSLKAPWPPARFPTQSSCQAHQLILQRHLHLGYSLAKALPLVNLKSQLGLFYFLCPIFTRKNIYMSLHDQLLRTLYMYYTALPASRK